MVAMNESVVMMDCVTRIHAILKVGGRRRGVARRTRRRKRKREKVIDDSQLGKIDGERRREVVWKTLVRRIVEGSSITEQSRKYGHG
jgi:hypothetical protein